MYVYLNTTTRPFYPYVESTPSTSPELFFYPCGQHFVHNIWFWDNAQTGYTPVTGLVIYSVLYNQFVFQQNPLV